MARIDYEELMDKCEEANKSPATFYRKDFIKSDESVETPNKKSCRTELISEYIVANFRLDKISVVEREKYKYPTHKGESDGNEVVEKVLAKELFSKCKNGYSFNCIGTIKDYETPLEKENKSHGAAIDLLSVNHDDKKVYILELKREGSPESLLRCILEAYTYLRMVHKENLFKKDNFNIPSDYNLVAAPLIFSGKGKSSCWNRAWQQVQEMEKGHMPKLCALIEKLKKTLDKGYELAMPFYLSKTENGDYIVSR